MTIEISPSFDIESPYRKTDSNITIDFKTFARRTNKIEQVGGFLKREKKKFLVECDGKGNLHFFPLTDEFEKLEKLDALRKKRIITDEEFEKKKKELLNRI